MRVSVETRPFSLSRAAFFRYLSEKADVLLSIWELIYSVNGESVRRKKRFSEAVPLVHIIASDSKLSTSNGEGYEEEFVKNLYETIIANGKDWKNEWLIGLEINTFQDLKDLMVVDQLKKRANASMKDHFLDNWANLKSATQIAELFDNYEDVRGVEILNAVQTRSQVKAAREERGIDSGDASKKGEDEVIIVSSDAEDEILIPASGICSGISAAKGYARNLINAQKNSEEIKPLYEQAASQVRVTNQCSDYRVFERFGILVRHSSVYHPQSNPVERFHRTLKRLLRVLCLDAGSEWDKHLPVNSFSVTNCIARMSTGYTPSELVYGKNLRTPETLNGTLDGTGRRG
ncbi:retrovirus-related Pol polyprotein from transposon 412 [Trichonephila clavipes]|nr:retrovirus-related Pol polyprotein from transposon 412 [Trichonephila clavipes]